MRKFKEEKMLETETFNGLEAFRRMVVDRVQVTWDGAEGDYIECLDDITITDNRGSPFSLTYLFDDDCLEWQEVVQWKEVSHDEAMQALQDGLQVETTLGTETPWCSVSLQDDNSVTVNSFRLSVCTDRRWRVRNG